MPLLERLFEILLGLLLFPVWLRWRAHERAVLSGGGEQAAAVTVETENR